jgi:hypothetical protein
MNGRKLIKGDPRTRSISHLGAEATRKTFQRRHKYGAVRTEVDNIRFSSKAEAKRYGELKLLEKAGLIRGLQTQVAIPLDTFTNTGRVRVGVYVADFRYQRIIPDGGEWELVTEDVKGFRTPLYRWKKKHVEAQYGITITEIT